MQNRILITLTTTLLWCNTLSVQAWNGFGHSYAAYIAEQHLTPEAKAKCEEYLQHSFVFYASWMDKWRYIDPYKPTSAWHVLFVDTDWKLKVEDTKRAHYQTERIWREMKDYKNLPDSLVRQNLIYLIHMVPDFHCPVHIFCGEHPVRHYFYSLNKEGKRFSAHSFWDSSPAFKREGWTLERYAKEVDHISPKVAKKYCKGSLLKWAYDAVEQSNRLYTITPSNLEITTMSQQKVEEIHALADEMILKGAYRLAYIINDIFKK